eukprot:1371021-Rhodomonas_salina.2
MPIPTKSFRLRQWTNGEPEITAQTVPHMRHRSVGDCGAGIVALGSSDLRGAAARCRDGRAIHNCHLLACIFRPVAPISLAELMSLRMMLTNEGSDKHKL